MSSGPAPIPSSRDGGQPSPRPRVGFAPSFDGVLNGGESWGARRRPSEGFLRAAARGDAGGGELQQDDKGLDIKEEEEEKPIAEQADALDGPGDRYPHEPSPQPSLLHFLHSDDGSREALEKPIINESCFTSETRSSSASGGEHTRLVTKPHPSLVDLASVEWSYLDPQGQVQGIFLFKSPLFASTYIYVRPLPS
jgi:PERQ amino acid-rich with GYF domain-containing protein